MSFDLDDKWTLVASVVVENGADQDQLQQAIDELLAVKTDFEGVFDLQALDRHILDTRVKFSG
jgi:mediator of RNA polymerase II transcription subunit 18